MKKFLPYLILLACLGGGVAYFIYAYSPSTLEKKESDFAVRNMNDVTKVHLLDERGQSLMLTKKGKNWIANGKYAVNQESLDMLFTAMQKMETLYPAPTTAVPIVLKDMARQRTKCEIYMNDEVQPSKVYYVGGPTADGQGTYVIMELNGQMGSRPYITHIAGKQVYLTGWFYPDIERWKDKWIFRDNDQDIQSLKLEYNREKQKSLEITRVAKDSFVLANSEGQVGEQPKQRFIHQYLEFYNGLSLEGYRDSSSAKDTILPTVPLCTITMKRTDKTETQVIVYYMPNSETSRVQYDDQGNKLIYDIEHYYLSMNNKTEFGLIQYYTWGKIFRSYQDFFTKPGANTAAVQ